MLKVLFALQLPFPIHGASIVGQLIKESKFINQEFESEYINTSISNSITEIGKNPLGKIIRYCRVLYFLLKKIIKLKPDVFYLAITAKGIGFYKDLPLVIIGKIFCNKIVLHYHNKGVKTRQKYFFDNLCYKFLFKNASVILLSKHLFDDIKFYVKEEDVYICPNGIVSPTYKNKIKTKENNIPKIFFLSNLIESKGILILLDALNLLKKQQLSFICKIVGGEGDLKASDIEERITKYELNDTVSYLGRKTGNDKYDLYEESDIFVFPTFYHNECFPLVLLEAMSFGLTLVSTNEGGISDIVVDNVNGFIVDKKNSKSLAKILTKLVENPEMSNEMGRQSKIMFDQKYTVDIFEKQFVNLIKKIECS